MTQRGNRSQILLPTPKAEIKAPRVAFNLDYCKGRKGLKLGKLGKGDKERLLRKLDEYEGLTLGQFRVHRGADLKMWRGSPPSPPQKNLPSDITGTPIMRFRISAKMRVSGYLKDNIFFVVWIDPTHKKG